jgi:sigma-B regulation protein RsbU (phosphoserine phosphatase)
MTDDHLSREKRIRDLERELGEREKDLAHYRGELARANKRLESLIGELSRDLRTANQIQKLLVPTEFPNIPGFEFSTKFLASAVSGGDYLDIFDQREKLRFGVLVASSSGYGLSALFLSVLLKTTGASRSAQKVAATVGHIAQELASEMKEGDSCDLFYGVVDRKNFELEYVLAGKVFAFHHSYSDDKLQPLDRSGEALAKGRVGALTSHSGTLNSRDRLILCSRGVVEATNLEGEEFGVQRLIASILAGPKSGVHELRNHVLFEVQKFSAGRNIDRDITVVVVEVKDRVIKLAKR